MSNAGPYLDRLPQNGRTAPEGRIRRWIIRRLGGFVEQKITETLIMGNHITGASAGLGLGAILDIGGAVKRYPDGRWAITPNTVVHVGVLEGTGSLTADGCSFYGGNPREERPVTPLQPA